MAPLPENNTHTYFVDYTFDGEEHTIQFRVNPSFGPDLIPGLASNFLAALGPMMDPQWQILGARWRTAGQNVTLPFQAPAQPAVGSLQLDPRERPRFVSFIGRGTTSGRRVRHFVYGLVFVTPPDYRLDIGDIQHLDNARQVLDEATQGYNVTIAGDAVQVYNYYNVGYNSYHERKLRG